MTARTRRATPLIHRVLQPYFRLTRGLTLGVRAMVIDDQLRVFLVRHSYVPGWHLPGGGVEPGETLLMSLARELQEEGNIVISGDPRLHGMFFNKWVSNRDHVAVYLVSHFRQTAPKQADHEILEAGFFARDALPEGTTGATLRRLAEALDGAPVNPFW